MLPIDCSLRLRLPYVSFNAFLDKRDKKETKFKCFSFHSGFRWQKMLNDNTMNHSYHSTSSAIETLNEKQILLLKCLNFVLAVPCNGHQKTDRQYSAYKSQAQHALKQSCQTKRRDADRSLSADGLKVCWGNVTA